MNLNIPFKSKDGRLIHPRPHEAVFRGKRNASKGKALMILNHFKERFLTSKQIHDYTGVSLAYLQQRLTFWYNIRYVNRKVVTPAQGRPYYSYQIARRGSAFVEIRIPPETFAIYKDEINEWNYNHKK